MVQLSVIIVSYNVKYYLEQCLRSVFGSMEEGVSLEVIVVDNASPDQSATYLRSKFPKSDFPYLHIISNSNNVGFGRANNQAVRIAQGEYILFLNPDTLLSEKTLKRSLEFAARQVNFGGLGTMMMHDNGNFAYESRRGMPTPWVSFCKMTGLNALFPHSERFGKYYMRYLDKQKPSEIEIISGAYLLVRKSVLDKVGVFDEEFFMYGEDIDLSYRIIQSGFKNYYLPSPIIHYKGESTKKNTFKYVHVFYNAMLIFFRKHYHNYSLILSVPVKLAIVLSAIFALLKQQLRLLKRFLLPVKKRPKEKMLYMGHHKDLFRKLAEEWGLDVDVVETDETQHSLAQFETDVREKGYVRMVFDTADFSYDYMLETIKSSSHGSYLGVYHSDQGILVTGAKVYSPQTIVL